jgi:hypothetical protein
MIEDLKKMSSQKLTDYIKKYRLDEEKVKEAIAEISSRPGWVDVSADTDLEEELRIIENLIAKKNL